MDIISLIAFVLLVLALIAAMVFIKPNERGNTGVGYNAEPISEKKEVFTQNTEPLPSPYAHYIELRQKRMQQAAEGDAGFRNSKEFEITGVHISRRKNYIIDYCAEFDVIQLKHEKNNAYSNKAIVVKHEGKKIGYIPEREVDDIHLILPQPHIARVTDIDDDGGYLNVYGIIKY